MLRIRSRAASIRRREFRLPRLAHVALTVHLVFALAACEGNGQPGSGLEAQGRRPAELPMPVAVEPARTGTIASYYTATATLEVEKEAQVLARVTGIVQSIAVEEGDIVSKGASLLLIENDEYRLRVDQAAANTTNLKSKLVRIEKAAGQVVSAEEHETAKNDLATAEAAEGLARLNLSYTNVTAPFAGRVVKRLADVGQNVSVGTPLFVLADFNPLLARVHVPAKEFKKLKADQEVELVLDSTGHRLRGVITLVSPTIDPGTGTIKVTVEVAEYPPETRPGDFAEVEIVTEKHTDSILVNKAAVITDKGDQVVFVAAGDIAERRVVTVGFTDHAHAEILSGVESGTPVVIKGQRSLKHGSPLKVIEEALPDAPMKEGLSP